MHQFARTELLIGPAGVDKLKNSKVAIYGVGGVGSYAVEALARAGIGHLILVDFDEICLTNINRQLGALHSTVGRVKVDVLHERIQDINPAAQVTIYREFITKENVESLIPNDCSYLVDAIDNITAKLALVQQAFSRGIPIIAAMGAGNRLDPSQLRIGDISETSIDPLARVMRRELKKRGIIKGLKVVYSQEMPLKPLQTGMDCKSECICPSGDAHCSVKRSIPGSISFVPPVAGMLMASEVVRDLLADKKIS